MFNVLVTFYCVLYLSLLVTAQDEIKRGDYPYMAFLYYPDDSVVDSNGNRFFQSAIIFRLDCLISASIDTKSNNDSAFPYNTLMARAGALTIDSKVVFNEDLDEQEREVVRIVRPTTHNEAAYWRTDITLLKTLVPFNSTQIVGVVPFKPTITFTDKTCIVLMYTKNSGTQRSLIKRSVDLISIAQQSCRPEFVETSMACGVDHPGSKQSADCMGNQGGPLICENNVFGIQTYLMNQCESPYLYQLLSGWQSFIICGDQNKCKKDYCQGICRDTDKDEPRKNSTTFLVNTDAEIQINAESLNVTRSSQAPEVTKVMETTKTPVSTTEERDNSVETGSKEESMVLEKAQEDSNNDTQQRQNLVQMLRSRDDSSEITNKGDEQKKLDEEHDLIKHRDDESMRQAVDALPKPNPESVKSEDITASKPNGDQAKQEVEPIIHQSVEPIHHIEPINRSVDQVNQSVEPVNQLGESINQAVKPIKLEVEPVKPETEPFKPEVESVKPEVEPVKPGFEAVTLEIEAVKAEIEKIKPDVEPVSQDLEPAAQETDLIKSETEPIKPEDLLKSETEPTKEEVEPANQLIDINKMEELEPAIQKKEQIDSIKSETEPIKSQVEPIKPDTMTSKPELETTESITDNDKAHSKQDQISSRKRFDLRRSGDSNIMKIPKKVKSDDTTNGLVQLISEYLPPKNSSTPAPSDNEDYFIAIVKINDTKPEENDKNMRVKMVHANTATTFIASLIRGICVAIVNLIILI